MKNIFERFNVDFSNYTYLALRPIVDGDLPTITSCPKSRHTNGAQLRGGLPGRPSEWLGEYKFKYGNDDKWITEWELVYRDFENLRTRGKPLWYTGSDCTFRLEYNEGLEKKIADRSKLQDIFGRPTKMTHIADPRLYEKASHATLQPISLCNDADALCGLRKWHEDATHILINLGFDDEPQIVGRTFAFAEEEEAVAFFFGLKRSLGLALWYDGAEALEKVNSKSHMYKKIKDNC